MRRQSLTSTKLEKLSIQTEVLDYLNLPPNAVWHAVKTARRLFRNQTTEAVSSNRAKETHGTAESSPSLHNCLHERGAGFCNAVFLTQFPTEHSGCVLGACAVLFTSVGEVPLLGNLCVASSIVSSFSRSVAAIVVITVC